MWLCTGSRPETGFLLLTQPAFDFCKYCTCFLCSSPLKDHRQNRVSPRLGGTLPPLCHHSNQIHFETCICRSSLVTERKFETLFFTVIMSVFLPALISLSSLVSKASVHLILWKLKNLWFCSWAAKSVWASRPGRTLWLVVWKGVYLGRVSEASICCCNASWPKSPIEF